VPCWDAKASRKVNRSSFWPDAKDFDMNAKTFARWLVLFLVAQTADVSQADDGARHVALGDEPQPTIYLWLNSSLSRIFPQSKPGSTKLDLIAARNGTISFQACLRNERTYALRVDGAIEGADDLKGQTRLVGLVPMPHVTPGTEPAELDGAGHLPGLVPDPLYPETKTLIGPQESRSYWITHRVPANANPASAN
jgi:hypothetical protein